MRPPPGGAEAVAPPGAPAETVAGRRLRAFETPTQKAKRKAKANAKRGKVKFRFNANALRGGTAAAGDQPAGAPGTAPAAA